MAKTKNERNQRTALLEKIQPQGGISFLDSRYIVTGSGYETCLHVYEYPKTLDDYWLARLCNINNTVSLMDISTDDIISVKKNINKSMREQQYRYEAAKTFDEHYDAQKRYAEMERLYDEINSLGEVIKLVHIRIFVADTSWEKLEDKVKTIRTQLESNSYLATIYMNETKQEWTSMVKPYHKQEQEPFFTYGQPLTSNAVAAGNPFHFSSLNDEWGNFLGKTPCGGNVLFYLFTKSGSRRYYNFLCMGTMGSGKSTLLKKELLATAMLGDYVRTFDISGEFTKLTMVLGGKVIKLDGTGGILNPLEILRGGDDDVVSFTRHISKVSTIYKFLVGGVCDTEELIVFEELLRELYREFGFEMKEGKMTREITGLPADQYPTFSDMLAFLQKKIEEIQKRTYEDVERSLVEKNLLQIDKIRKVIENIVYTYGNLFNGHTTIDNIQDEQIVTFDISSLKEMKAEIFDAQIFNMVSLCWDNCVTNGKLMLKGMYDKTIDPWDVTHTLILIDESHRWVNAKKTHALDLITVYLREARKYFGGIGLASQSIRDYVPEGSGSEEIDKMKTIFELTQYKFIFHQDSNVTKMMNTIFEGVLTPTQIARIPKLDVGENILSISSDRNIEFKVYLPKDEEAIFEGGL